MMRIDILSAVPQLLDSPLKHSIVKRAQENKQVEIFVHNLHDYTHDKYKTIDDKAFGGGAGMILKPEPFFECLEKLTTERKYDEIIFLSPDGEQFNQSTANYFSMKQNLILLAGHYKGIDQRVRDFWVTKEISIGDYVLTGGELPALVLVDSIVRILPGAIGDSESALSDSFQTGLLEGPVYTRPAEYRNLKVPDILLSGDHKKIDKWQLDQSILKTKKRRPDLLEK